MSAAKNPQTTNIFQVVSDMQESMENHGLSQDVVDALVRHGLEILLGTDDDSSER
jgi:hypothetical protein